MASALHSSTSTFAGVSFSPSFRSQQTSQPRKRLPSIKASATSPDPAALVSRRAGLLGVLGVAATLLPGSSAHAECSLATSPSGVAFCDLTVGTGPAAVSGTLVKAHYIGRLRATGETFDASYGGRPLVFKIGAGQVGARDVSKAGGATMPAPPTGGLSGPADLMGCMPNNRIIVRTT
eukprot:jgi/Mesvir1/7432/Mv19213-RA.1